MYRLQAGLFTTAWHRDSISPDTDTAYGQLLRRMPVTDDPNTRYGLAAPDEALRAALRVRNRVRKLLRIDVYALSSDGHVRGINVARNHLHEPGDRGTLTTCLRDDAAR
jgi:hypothetical protein